MKKIIYKVPGGKLLRVQFETEGGIIKYLRITGDFFIHPEEAILEIEDFLIGKDINFIAGELNEFLSKKDIVIIGFKAKDIALIINQNILLNERRK